MRLSILASSALAVGFISLSTAAYAGCGSSNSLTCNSNSGYSSHSNNPSHSNSWSSGSHSSSYGYGYTSSSQAACPSGSSRDSSGLCMSHSSSYSSSSYSSGGSTIVPFSTTVSSISNYRVNGMGANEHLSPTTCPVSVYNPGGGKVLGCYSVVKPAPVIVRPAPVIIQRPVYHTVRVVRPIIYVRYPVPVAVPVMRPTCGGVTTWSRYGANWPRAGWGQRGGCGGW